MSLIASSEITSAKRSAKNDWFSSLAETPQFEVNALGKEREVEVFSGVSSGDAPTSVTVGSTLKSVVEVVKKPEYKEMKAVEFEWVNILQTWEGIVTHVDYENLEFTAILTDRTNKSAPEEEMVMDISAINPGDKTLLQAGAVFYWNVGQMQINASGTIKNHSDIRMRRLPALSKVQLKKAKEFGKAISEKLHAG